MQLKYFVSDLNPYFPNSKITPSLFENIDATSICGVVEVGTANLAMNNGNIK